MKEKGILIVGHGSRLPEVNEEFRRLVDTLRASTKRDIRGANLTLADPKVDVVIKKMYEEGYREITVIPYFLSNGTHVVKNIPDLLKDMEREYPGLKTNQESSLLMDSLVIKAMENKINRH